MKPDKNHSRAKEGTINVYNAGLNHEHKPLVLNKHSDTVLFGSAYSKASQLS